MLEVCSKLLMLSSATSVTESSGLDRVGQNCIYIHTVYDCMCGDFPAVSTVYTLFLCGSGQP